MLRTTLLAALALTTTLACATGPTPPPPPVPASATTVGGQTGTTTSPAASGNALTNAPAPVQSAAPPAPVAAEAPKEVTVGQPPPDFTATDQDGKPVHLADLKGKWVVVYFYPKDETPGCTKEACSFRDAWEKLQKRGVVIIGVSADTAASHKAFAAHWKLPFTLVADPDGAIAAKFGVPVKDGYEKRQSFVVGPDGTVRKIYRTVDVTHHADEILADTST
jgi:peroxiredoxin Q/BCP